MVSLRRRRLLGLCSGSSSFVTPLPLYCENLTGSENSTRHAKPKSEQPVPSDDASILDSNTIVQEEPGSSNLSGSSSSKEQRIQPITGPPVKRRKRHRRKNWQNQEPCLMRGVYFKNMKWQAAIKVDKKQIHLGTVGSQEEATHLYDRWLHEVNGEYTVSSGYQMLNGPSIAFPLHKLIWNSITIPKHRFIAWLAAHNKLKKDRLAIFMQVPQTCRLCNHENETRDHLFFDCSWSRALLEHMCL